jgi:hypothetical protein
MDPSPAEHVSIVEKEHKPVNSIIENVNKINQLLLLILFGA